MPSCSIVECGARKNSNLPQLTLHRFPKNEILKKKWLEAIGETKMSPRHKLWHICSLHFEKKWFNTTLDVMRLHENAVPTIFSTLKKPLLKTREIKKSARSQLSRRIVNTVHKKAHNKKHQNLSVVCKTRNVKESDPLQLPLRIVGTVRKEAPDKTHQDLFVVCQTNNIKGSGPLQLPVGIVGTVLEGTPEKSHHQELLSETSNIEESSPLESPQTVGTVHKEALLQKQRRKLMFVRETSKIKESVPLQLPQTVETVHKEAPLHKERRKLMFLCETSNVKESVPLQLPQTVETVHETTPEESHHQELLSGTSDIEESAPLQLPRRTAGTVHKKVVRTIETEALKERCIRQQKQIKNLTENLRKKSQTIANLRFRLANLRKKSMKEAIVIVMEEGGTNSLLETLN